MYTYWGAHINDCWPTDSHRDRQDKQSIPLCTTNYVALCRIYEVYGVYFKLSQIIYHSLWVFSTLYWNIYQYTWASHTRARRVMCPRPFIKITSSYKRISEQCVGSAETKLTENVFGDLLEATDLRPSAPRIYSCNVHETEITDGWACSVTCWKIALIPVRCQVTRTPIFLRQPTTVYYI